MTKARTARLTADRLTEFARRLHSKNTIAQVAEVILEQAPELLGCSDAALSIYPCGRPSVARGTTPVSPYGDAFRMANRLQIILSQGPTVDVYGGAEHSGGSDLSIESRWPEWGPRASGLGLGSVLAVRLTSRDGGLLGALTFADASPDWFDRGAVADATMVAAHAAIGLVGVGLGEDLAHVLESRAVIGRAMGILMERFGIDADRAFEILKRRSQDGNVKLRALATYLVDHRELPPARTSDKSTARPSHSTDTVDAPLQTSRHHQTPDTESTMPP